MTNTYIILTVTLKGVAAVAVGSIMGGALSGAEPGMLRLRPVLSGGESVRQRDRERFFLNLLCHKEKFLPCYDKSRT